MAEMHTLTDHVGRMVNLPVRPQRIISLCPSQTATLYALGLSAEVVGRTYFCIHPEEQVEAAVKVGGTKQVKMDRIEALQPDLIIAEKEENPKEMVEALAERYPVYVTEVRDIPECLRMVRDLGNITDRVEPARELVRNLEGAFEGIEAPERPIRCLYFIWRKPWMVVGANTFIDAVLRLGGWENVATECPDRYPALEVADFARFDPEVILLSSEPFPFTDKHIDELKTWFPNAKFALVDGELFSWYGSRMLLAPPYLNTLSRRFRNT